MIEVLLFWLLKFFEKKYLKNGGNLCNNLIQPPRSINAMDYDQIVLNVEKLFNPATFVICERYKFWSNGKRKPGDFVNHDRIMLTFVATLNLSEIDHENAVAYNLLAGESSQITNRLTFSGIFMSQGIDKDLPTNSQATITTLSPSLLLGSEDKIDSQTMQQSLMS